MVRRKFKESPLTQGADEKVPYQLTTTPWGTDPSSPVTTIKDRDGNATSTLLSTSVTTVSGDVITTPLVQNLVAGNPYTMEIKFTVGSTIFEAWGEIKAEA